MVETAVITGATSGLGAAYARRLAADGYDLIITGRRQAIIKKLADELSQHHPIKIRVIIAELSDDGDLQKLIETIEVAENVSMLINNAGYSGPPGYFDETQIIEYEKLIKVHQLAPLKLIGVVLPKMIERRCGDIINVASMAALFPFNKGAVYGGTKAFLKLFSESLNLDLKKKGIRVQVLCPGSMQSDFYRNRKDGYSNRYLKKISITSTERIVDYSLKCLKRNQVICIPGLRNKTKNGLFSILPRTAWYKAVELFE